MIAILNRDFFIFWRLVRFPNHAFEIAIDLKAHFDNVPSKMEYENALQACIVIIASSAYYPQITLVFILKSQFY